MKANAEKSLQELLDKSEALDERVQQALLEVDMLLTREHAYQTQDDVKILPHAKGGKEEYRHLLEDWVDEINQTTENFEDLTASWEDELELEGEELDKRFEEIYQEVIEEKNKLEPDAQPYHKNRGYSSDEDDQPLHEKAICAVLQTFFNTVQGIDKLIGKVKDNITAPLADKISTAFTNLKNSVENFVNKVQTNRKEQTGSESKPISEAFEKFKDRIQTTKTELNNIKIAIKSSANQVIKNPKSPSRWAMDAIKDAREAVIKANEKHDQEKVSNMKID